MNERHYMRPCYDWAHLPGYVQDAARVTDGGQFDYAVETESSWFLCTPGGYVFKQVAKEGGHHE